MNPSEREEIEKVARDLSLKIFIEMNMDFEPPICLPDDCHKWIADAILTQVAKARAESKYIPSELELFTILKKAYYENSELTGDQLWLKLSKSIRNKLNQKGE